jgi:hypothetical protein
MAVASRDARREDGGCMEAPYQGDDAVTSHFTGRA